MVSEQAARIDAATAITLHIEDDTHQTIVSIIAAGRLDITGVIHVPICPVCHGEHRHLRRVDEGSIMLRGLPCCDGEIVYAIFVGGEP